MDESEDLDLESMMRKKEETQCLTEKNEPVVAVCSCHNLYQPAKKMKTNNAKIYIPTTTQNNVTMIKVENYYFFDDDFVVLMRTDDVTSGRPSTILLYLPYANDILH